LGLKARTTILPPTPAERSDEAVQACDTDRYRTRHGYRAFREASFESQPSEARPNTLMEGIQLGQLHPSLEEDLKRRDFTINAFAADCQATHHRSA
jgi:hypothetical protein